MNRCVFAGLLGVFLAGGLISKSEASNSGDEVIVLYNTRVPESKGVAEHYASRRQVPSRQVIGLPLSTGDEMTRSEFRDRLEKPLAEQLSEKGLWRIRSEIVRGASNQASRVLWKPVESKIRYAVLCYGIPYRIKPVDGLKEPETAGMRQELRRNESCVDTELALLPLIRQTYPVTGPFMNPLYGSTNDFLFHPTNGVLMVTRLDGPSPEIARGLVDKAMEAETNGLWGRAYVDLRNIADTNYAIGDTWMRGAAEMCRVSGFETTVDTNAGTFEASFPMSQIAFYAGWYDADVSGPFTRSKVEFMPGAFAYHLHSYSAANLRNAKANWVGPFLAKGATASMGSVAEPYLGGTPDMAVFAQRFLLNGFTFGEAAYAAQSALSWQTTIVGDPLYRPFGRPGQQVHEELASRKSPWLEWSFLRLVNLNLVRGIPPANMARFLEQVPLTRESAVLSEKLANLYAYVGKPTGAAEVWERALNLEPSPMQAVRIRLALSEKLAELDRNQEAVETLAKLLQQDPEYPGRADVYRRLAGLAAKLGRAEAAERYEQLAREAAN